MYGIYVCVYKEYTNKLVKKAGSVVGRRLPVHQCCGGATNEEEIIFCFGEQ